MLKRLQSSPTKKINLFRNETREIILANICNCLICQLSSGMPFDLLRQLWRFPAFAVCETLTRPDNLCEFFPNQIFTLSLFPCCLHNLLSSFIKILIFNAKCFDILLVAHYHGLRRSRNSHYRFGIKINIEISENINSLSSRRETVSKSESLRKMSKKFSNVASTTNDRKSFTFISMKKNIEINLSKNY